MPVLESTKRSLRKARSNRVFNLNFMDSYRKLIKQFVVKPTSEGLAKVYSGIDKGVKLGIFHRNKGARLKSKMSGKMPSKKKA